MTAQRVPRGTGQGALPFTEPTVHCFFAGTCDHTVMRADPQAAHDDMEAHYSARHAEEIRRLIG